MWIGLASSKVLHCFFWYFEHWKWWRFPIQKCTFWTWRVKKCQKFTKYVQTLEQHYHSIFIETRSIWLKEDWRESIDLWTKIPWLCDIQTNGETYRQTDRWTQTDRHTHRHKRYTHTHKDRKTDIVIYGQTKL